MRRAGLFCIVMFLAADCAAVRAADFIPVPDFTSHLIPQTENPAPRSDAREYLDLAFLAAALTLASYLAIEKRSRRGMLVLAIVSLAWLGFWRKGCVCPIGAIQNVALALADKTYAVPATVVAIFALPLLFALFTGRTFCAAVCPLGTVQELAALRPMQLPRWLDHSLGLLAYVYLGAAVVLASTGAGFIICRYDPLVALFRLSGSTAMLLLAGGLLLLGVFIGRPYCRFLCPYGALLRLLSPLARWHLRIPPQGCIQCRLCEDVCPYGAIREPTVPLPVDQRRFGRRRVAALVVLVPALIGLAAWLGTWLQGPLAHLHPTVALAERISLEQAGRAQGASDAAEAFRNSGRPVAELYREARLIVDRMGTAGGWLGGWVGLVLGVKLVRLSVRRRRTDYQPDRANCVSCGRCFWYCPSEQARLGWIQEIEVPSPSARGSG
ncbi:MAG: 4Fe-4S binding protein [Thermoguttaceae bacterium]|jgi:polyferredoxin